HGAGRAMGCVVRLDDVVEVEEAVMRGEDEYPVGPQRVGGLSTRTVIRADVHVRRACGSVQFAAAARDDDEFWFPAVERVGGCHVCRPACFCEMSAAPHVAACHLKAAGLMPCPDVRPLCPVREFLPLARCPGLAGVTRTG